VAVRKDLPPFSRGHSSGSQSGCFTCIRSKARFLLPSPFWRDRADRLRALPLPRVLAALEATADPGDPAKWHCARGVLSVTGPKFINWNQGVGGGGAIDLVMHVRQVGFGQALEWLEARFGITARSWRGLAPGSRKDRGFFSVSVAAATQAIVLCESAIDALSCQALHPDYRCLSTSGARPHPAWLRTLIAQGLPTYCGFDADPTGEAMAQRMIQLHPSIRRLSPPAKDWNDAVRSHSR
jgi:hypothetical protein